MRALSQFLSLTPNAATHHEVCPLAPCTAVSDREPFTQSFTSSPSLAPGIGGEMREDGLPEVSPRIYLIYRLPKLESPTSELPEELVESNDAKVSLPE